jgi:hypothetical protein
MTMTLKTRVAILGLSGVMCSGCAAAAIVVPAGLGVGTFYMIKKMGGSASSEANLQRETGRILNVDPVRISVYEIDRHATNVSWKATTPDGTYNCSADDMVRRPACFPAGGSASGR